MLLFFFFILGQIETTQLTTPACRTGSSNMEKFPRTTSTATRRCRLPECHQRFGWLKRIRLLRTIQCLLKEWTSLSVTEICFHETCSRSCVHTKKTATHYRSVKHHRSVDKHHRPLDKHHTSVDKHQRSVDKHHTSVDKHHRFVDKHHKFVDKHNTFVDKHYMFVDKHHRPADKTVWIYAARPPSTAS